jgi:hypothetical protein
MLRSYFGSRLLCPPSLNLFLIILYHYVCVLPIDKTTKDTHTDLYKMYIDGMVYMCYDGIVKKYAYIYAAPSQGRKVVEIWQMKQDAQCQKHGNEPMQSLMHPLMIE